MAVLAMTDATCWVGGWDASGDLNQVSVSVSTEELDTTTFGSAGYRSRIAGPRSVQADIAGFWQSAASAAPDPELVPDLGTADRAVTIAPTSTEGAVAYLFQAGKFSSQLFGAIGEAVPFSASLMGTSAAGLVRGVTLKSKGTVSATGATGTAVQLGAVASGQYLYVAFHAFTVGTSITAVVESDVDNTFSAATTRATIGPITSTGGTWATRVAGPITHTWYRLRVTAVTGTHTIACAAGIGS